MRRLPLVLPALLLLLSIAPAAAREPEKLTLSEVNFGEQVSGPTLSLHDLAGRVVLVYHWCVSCPMSTGAFPYVNGLVEKYGERGLTVVGFQVRRNPEVETNDVVWYLEHLDPSFPVVHYGWTCEWPQAWLPWAVLFDHEGREIYRGGLQAIEPLIEKALGEAPDPLCGGQYDRLRDAAAGIAGDHTHAGRHLAELRRMAADPGSDEAARAEAESLIGSVERWFAGQMEKAARDADGPVERARVIRNLAEMFEGDELGVRAKEELAKVANAPGFAAEEEAWAALGKARAAFRRLPPPGRYIYHPTEMIYETLTDRPLLDRRARVYAVFREEMERIRRVFPGTYAADIAGDLLFEHEPQALEEAAASERLERAARLTAKGGDPGDLVEGALLLREVVDGRPEGDGIKDPGRRAARRHRPGAGGGTGHGPRHPRVPRGRGRGRRGRGAGGREPLPEGEGRGVSAAPRGDRPARGGGVRTRAARRGVRDEPPRELRRPGATRGGVRRRVGGSGRADRSGLRRHRRGGRRPAPGGCAPPDR